MAKLLAVWGTYDLPEILCIKGKKCHEVTQEKERQNDTAPVFAEEGWLG